MTIMNCPNCGGDHYGSHKCPLLGPDIPEDVRRAYLHRDPDAPMARTMVPVNPTLQCACKSTDRYDCWALRYFGHTAVSGMRVDEDGGPCECDCHNAADNVYPEHGGPQDWPGEENVP